MDPLSLTASIIAIIGVGGQVANTVRRLSTLSKASDLMMTLNNEMSDLFLVVITIQDVFHRQQNKRTTLSAIRGEEIYVDSVIIRSLEQANKVVVELKELHDRLFFSPTGGLNTTNKVRWLREQGKVKQIQKDLRSVRLNLSAALGIFNSYVYDD